MFILKSALAILFLVTYTQAVRYLVKKDDSKDFDGVGVGLIHRPTDCTRSTSDGDLLRVYFNGTLSDGSAFETRWMAEPFEFVLGEGQVIMGWEAGLQDMCEGESRHLTVPSKYAWGDGGIGEIPSRTTLYFTVTLISFQPISNAPRKENVFSSIDQNEDGFLTHDEVRQYLRAKGTKDINGDHGMKQMLREIFQEEDRDKNGYITQREFSGRKHDEF